MENEVYITGVVIPNGVADHEGDLLNKKDILKIFTKYLDRETDTMHSYIKNKGVDVLANWISETDQKISGKNAPAGSWLSTLRVTNPEIIKSIREGKITGLSLGSIPEYALKQKFWFINKSITYSDLNDIDEVIPIYISFVDKPSNGYRFEVVDYNTYINKNRSDDKMVEQTTEIKEETVSINAIGKIAEIFGINKAESEPVKEETEPVKEEKTDDISNKELLEKIPTAVETGMLSAFEKMQANQPTVDKKEDTEQEGGEKPSEEEPEKEEPKIDKSETEPVKEKIENAQINKRQTEKTENVEVPNVNTNFYKKSGRDMFGCRIK